jgi:2-C-methyl-D-erythritol 2,4-cyclodiphosphate synthase
MGTYVGVGFDAHRFADGIPLLLGTIEVEHPQGLAGHSDGDVLAHAIVDAILGAGGGGDIGARFPSSDPQWRDVASRMFLDDVSAWSRESGFTIVNVDATLICEEPRIDPYREKMQAALADATGARRVNVKATTTDRMGFTGHGDGIAAFAVALLED